MVEIKKKYKEKEPIFESWEDKQERLRKEEEASIKEINKRITEEEIVNTLGYLPEGKVSVIYAMENLGMEGSDDVEPEGEEKIKDIDDDHELPYRDDEAAENLRQDEKSKDFSSNENAWDNSTLDNILHEDDKSRENTEYYSALDKILHEEDESQENNEDYLALDKILHEEDDFQENAENYPALDKILHEEDESQENSEDYSGLDKILHEDDEFYGNTEDFLVLDTILHEDEQLNENLNPNENVENATTWDDMLNEGINIGSEELNQKLDEPIENPNPEEIIDKSEEFDRDSDKYIENSDHSGTLDKLNQETDKINENLDHSETGNKSREFNQEFDKNIENLNKEGNIENLGKLDEISNRDLNENQLTDKDAQRENDFIKEAGTTVITAEKGLDEKLNELNDWFQNRIHNKMQNKIAELKNSIQGIKIDNLNNEVQSLKIEGKLNEFVETFNDLGKKIDIVNDFVQKEATGVNEVKNSAEDTKTSKLEQSSEFLDASRDYLQKFDTIFQSNKRKELIESLQNENLNEKLNNFMDITKELENRIDKINQSIQEISISKDEIENLEFKVNTKKFENKEDRTIKEENIRDVAREEDRSVNELEYKKRGEISSELNNLLKDETQKKGQLIKEGIIEKKDSKESENSDYITQGNINEKSTFFSAETIANGGINEKKFKFNENYSEKQVLEIISDQDSEIEKFDKIINLINRQNLHNVLKFMVENIKIGKVTSKKAISDATQVPKSTVSNYFKKYRNDKIIGRIFKKWEKMEIEIGVKKPLENTIEQILIKKVENYSIKKNKKSKNFRGHKWETYKPVSDKIIESLHKKKPMRLSEIVEGTGIDHNKVRTTLQLMALPNRRLITYKKVKSEPIGASVRYYYLPKDKELELKGVDTSGTYIDHKIKVFEYLEKNPGKINSIKEISDSINMNWSSVRGILEQLTKLGIVRKLPLSNKPWEPKNGYSIIPSQRANFYKFIKKLETSSQFEVSSKNIDFVVECFRQYVKDNNLKIFPSYARLKKDKRNDLIYYYKIYGQKAIADKLELEIPNQMVIGKYSKEKGLLGQAILLEPIKDYFIDLGFWVPKGKEIPIGHKGTIELVAGKNKKNLIIIDVTVTDRVDFLEEHYQKRSYHKDPRVKEHLIIHVSDKFSENYYNFWNKQAGLISDGKTHIINYHKIEDYFNTTLKEKFNLPELFVLQEETKEALQDLSNSTYKKYQRRAKRNKRLEIQKSKLQN